ncbi:Endogenous retrovirus group FC1 Env polyprotein [Plecturocebus cupreus]
MGYSVTSAAQLENKLRVAIEASAASLASLQQQIMSLAQVTLQNLRALNLLTAEKGGTCMFLQEECGYYINESGLVEENINTLHCLQEDLCKKPNTGVWSLSWRHPMLTWLTPIITPVIVPTNSYVRNWTSGRQPNAASSLRPALSRGTSQLTCPHYFAPIQQEVVRKSGALYLSSKGRNVRLVALL